ncbi:hypothetical protein SAMN06298216_2707 [Spirosomataceae bacterium TFI 002]|nr:hypothetical protein SAMN06298216_2707 [Spirosomataceae bacterium TFI 002]
MIKKTLILLNIVALIAALIWLFVSPDWEPLVTSLGLISSLIVLVQKKSENGNIQMTQKGGKGSVNYQSSGDININKNDK